MIFLRFYDEQLAQASYLVGCPAAGAAIVIDPNRAVDQYIAAAERAGLPITHVTETHIHADFVSGTRELASRTGATMVLSDAGPPEWQYAFRHDPGVALVIDGARFRVGSVEFTVLHTPGHTPEHISFLLTDTATSSEPMGVFTGDFVFVGDVGRPDLLEKAAHLVDESESSARMLFQSLLRFKSYPDHLQIWPGHGAGSACGKGLSAVPQSTLGYERRVNWAFEIEEESTFVSAVLTGQPEPPGYFGRMKMVNREGPLVVGHQPAPERVGIERIERAIGDGYVLDARSMESFAAGHIPGTINIPWGKGFTTYAGSVVPADEDLYLILPDESEPTAEAIARALLLIGYERVRGFVGSEAIAQWGGSGRITALIPQLTVRELASMDRSGFTVVDVRGRSEWATGHLAEALLIPLPELVDRLDEIPTDRRAVLHCQGGGRSAIAASLLLARGYKEICNLTGGFGAWMSEGLPVSLEP